MAVQKYLFFFNRRDSAFTKNSFSFGVVMDIFKKLALVFVFYLEFIAFTRSAGKLCLLLIIDPLSILCVQRIK